MPRTTRPAATKSSKPARPAAGALGKRLAAALEQQAATAEILRVISRSRTDAQPVFDTIAEAALKLCNASSAVVTRFDGELIRLAALANVSREGADALRRRYPRPPGPDTANARAILTRSIVAVPDVLADAEYSVGVGATAAPFRSVLSVPLMRDGNPIGALSIGRPEPGVFPDEQIALLQTFADQAVIAIENVRLFKELELRNASLTESLEQQTATSEILRVISQSPTDVQPVFETIAANALRLCHARFSTFCRFDGETIHLAVLHHVKPEGVAAFHAAYPCRPNRGGVTQRAILTGRVVHIANVLEDPEYTYVDAATSADYRSVLSVPLMRDGAPVGAITVFRDAPEPFPDPQVELLKTFADQALIAIENVRLFAELGARNRDLTEALEQQTATSGILRVISRSQTDVQPVFEAIARSARSLCDATFGNVYLLEDGILTLAASDGLTPEELALFASGYPRRIGTDTVTGRAALESRVIQTPDLLADPDYASAPGSRVGARTVLGVPMLRQGQAIGSIGVWRSVIEPFSETQIALLRTFADQAVIAIENVRLFKELEQRNSALTESLEQQTATSEILRVISRSQTDVQPVFETLAENAVRLCDADKAFIFRFDGEALRMAAAHNASPELEEFQARNPHFPGRKSCAGRAALTRQTVHISDAQADPEYGYGDPTVNPVRTVLGVPLLKGDQLLGAIVIYKLIVNPFSGKQIALMETFADQAVIAIENVRLFKELEQRNSALTESLEQQTATSEILRVISGSPTDLQPVMDAVVESAARLCGAHDAMLRRVDGDDLRRVAHFGPFPEREGTDVHPVNSDTVGSRAFLERRTIHIEDIVEEFRKGNYMDGRALQRPVGYRTVLAVPLIREDTAIGVILIRRMEVQPFSDNQIALLQTFADQAVIAIENVRLFTELEQRNRALTESLAQQTSMSDILRVISQSPTDVQPVLETIVRNAVRLCGASFARVLRFDGELLHFVATSSAEPEFLDVLRKRYPMRPDASQVAGRVIQSGSVIGIEDALADPDYARDVAVAGRLRRMLGVPMMRDDKPLGVITVGWAEPGPVLKVHEELLKTFADQAVIAIENVRLFTELEARTTQLTRSVGELKALGEVGHAVSSTLDLPTVLSTIVSRAARLAGMDGGAIYEYDEATGEFHLHTTDGLPDELVAALRASPVLKGEGALGRMAVAGEPVQIRDIATERSYKSRLRETIIQLGYRSLLAVPLLRDDRLLGGLVVYRNTAGEFAPEVIELLKTFATQSALAIQNARLFREIEVKSGQLELASRHKSEFLANMSHELRTPLNAIIGFSEVLSEQMFGEINDKQAEYLKDILESGRHLLSLINDILDLSKIEAGRMELEPGDFELPAAIGNALTLLRERANRHGIALGCEIDGGLRTVHADERKVKQVLLNLLTNALKFTPDGGRVDVRAGARDGFAEISVTDTGIGISPADQARVFEEFRQVGSTSKKVEGTGLGLAISRKFIELHGGRIWVTSEVGAGSTFTFTLPLQSSPR